MSPSAHEQWMEELLDRAQTVVSPRPPRNVLERVGAVLHSQTIRYVDPDLSGNMSDDLISGRICVFTDSFLAVVDVEGVPASYVNLEPGSNTGRVSVEFVARSTLSQITMEADGESWLNSAEVWDQALGDGQWPGAQARVDLHYPALAVPVTVPSHVREAFGPFLRSLLDDLART